MASGKGGVSSYKQDPSGAQAGPWRTVACKGTGKAACRASRPCQRQVGVVIGAGRAGQEFCWLRSHTAGHITHCHAQTCTRTSPSFGDHKQKFLQGKFGSSVKHPKFFLLFWLKDKAPSQGDGELTFEPKRLEPNY